MMRATEMKMGKKQMGPQDREAVEQVLGYLNFSAGKHDPAMLASLNRLWAVQRTAAGPAPEAPTWREIGRVLHHELDRLDQNSAAFADVTQARAILAAVFNGVLPEYLAFHADLLFHQDEESVFNAFFVGFACEAALRQGPPYDDTADVARGAIEQLNDFMGYRPVAVLEGRKIEPYARERLRPVPLYVRDAGVAVGRYQQVVELALELLRQTDEDLLAQSFFDPALLDELAFDPRAYDFDHPVNKRPNYHFGMWDPHRLDNQGRYRRFVVQQVTLDALMQRLDDPPDLPRDELLFEAAAVLAGTVLMSTGISGRGAETHDSNTTLATLLPRIAAYRDTFYQRLMQRTAGRHVERLRVEEEQRRQPFGVARQHLNAQLARRRASQLEHVQLAKIFARMGYPQAAAQQANIVPTASARVLCQIDCRLTATRHSIDAGDVPRAAELLSEVVGLLRRGIECGAIVDPWNILGFDAQFSLFPALENSVHDHRVDELVELMEQVFGQYARAWSRAAAGDGEELPRRLSADFGEIAGWWRQFAAHEVSNVDAVDSQDAFQAAERVAQAIRLWHQGGAAAGDIGFWAPHVEMFDSPRAYALVIEALFEQDDFVAAMSLLIHWLGEAGRVALEQGENSFHRLAERWLVEVRKTGGNDNGGVEQETWQRISKFFDYLEANAGEFWDVPSFALVPESLAEPEEAYADNGDGEEDDEDDLFRAAYEDMVYRDSTDDGVEGDIFDQDHAATDELMLESDRIVERLAFLTTLARLWRIAALSRMRCPDGQAGDRVATLRRWREQAAVNRARLTRLVEVVDKYGVAPPTGDHDSMLEYDRRRLVKEAMLERIIETSVETADAARLVAAAEAAEAALATKEILREAGRDSDRLEERLAVATLAAVLRRDLDAVRETTSELIAILADRPLLYVPLAKGGDPCTIVDVRVRQRYIQDLQKCLPRLGLFVEACRLIETAREMERNNPVGPGAVTEFDELFKAGYKSLVECLVTAAADWDGDPRSPDHAANSDLVARLEQLTESLLISWLAHSRTLRLSVLEKVTDKRAWNQLVDFIERYGKDLFTQRFLNLGNVRAILHQGVEKWLAQIKQEHPDDLGIRLLDELDVELPLPEAADCLTLVLEAVVENYAEYRDYNSTTTQSDRGELLYMLLDFLRLRARYDRVCWNLKPVVLAHQILVRHGCKRAAQMWRRALRDRIGEEADKYQKKLKLLQKKYAMQMPSIADRIGERFVRALVIDRVCALVQPAVDEARHESGTPTFRLLEYETEFLTREPSGVGFDVPAWLVALEEEVERVRLPDWERDDYDELKAAVPAVRMTNDEIEDQLNEWTGE